MQLDDWIERATVEYHDPETVKKECQRLAGGNKYGKWSINTRYYANQLLVSLSKDDLYLPSCIKMKLTIILPFTFPIHPPVLLVNSTTYNTWMRQHIDGTGRLHLRLPTPHTLLSVVSAFEQWMSSEPVSLVKSRQSCTSPTPLPGTHNPPSHTNLLDRVKVRLLQMRQDLQEQVSLEQAAIMADMKILEENKQRLSSIRRTLSETKHQVDLDYATMRSSIEEMREYLTHKSTDYVWCEDAREDELLQVFLQDAAITSTIHSLQSIYQTSQTRNLKEFLSTIRQLSRQLFLTRHRYQTLKLD